MNCKKQVMNRILCALWGLLLVIGCKQKPAETATVDSVHMAEQLTKEDTTLINTQGVREWINKTLQTKSAQTRHIELEEHWQGEPAYTSAFEPTKQFYADYATMLRWSPDSSRIVDIGSYGTVLVKDENGNTTIEAGEPDTELALLNPATKTRKRLMFVGPSSQILDAKWLNNNEVSVIGTFDTTGNGNNDTLLWMINIKTDLFRLYNVKSHR
jgi:hypothetical protein